MNITRGYIEIIKDVHEVAVTSVRTTCGETREFKVTMVLHQGPALSPYVFALIIDKLTAYIQVYVVHVVYK